MAAGNLRSRVTFAARSETGDEYGNTLTEFNDQFTVSAQITPRLGGEAVMASRLAGHQPVTIRVRQSTQSRLITTDWRATDARKSTVFNIRSIVDPDEGVAGASGQWFDLLCEAGVAA